MPMPVVLISFMASATCVQYLEQDYVTWYGSGSLLTRFYGVMLLAAYSYGKIIPSAGLVYAYICRFSCR
ncbi:hypothetical protein ACFQ9Y_11450 [Peribacillus simplex]|uniref:hypothetical protein n=1 Tax=Peribacillus simplex TaxID=1478 RepID=UPI00366D350C